MNNLHLTDEMIQQFIWDADMPDESAKTHILICDYCKTRAENYRLLFADLEELPKPVFNVDISRLVLDQIREQNLSAVVNNGGTSIPAKSVIEHTPATGYLTKPKVIWPGIVIGLMAIGLIGTPVYLFQDYFTDIVAEVSVMGTYLIIITVLLIAVFLVVDEYRKYTHRINSLDI